MKYLVLCGTLGLLCFIGTVSARDAALTPVIPREDGKEKTTVDFVPKHTASLSCNGTNLESGAEVKWRKEVEGEQVPIEDIKELKGRTTTSKKGNIYKLAIQGSVEDDAGVYTCYTKDDDEEVSGQLRLASKMAVKVPRNQNVVEGEKLRIQCNVVGNPAPKLHWHYFNDTYNHTYYASEDRVILESDPEKNIENSVLRIDEVFMYDRGTFSCIGKSEVEDKEVRENCKIRIKDKYAALWPFLGICAEVFILCAIIFIYEKKRNKSELEESDTDQSPDQKNTPDHGKDSNLRHRQQ